MTDNNDKSSSFSNLERELEMELEQSLHRKAEPDRRAAKPREPFVSIAEASANLQQQAKPEQPDFIDLLTDPVAPPAAASKNAPKTDAPNVETYNFYDDYVEETEDIVDPPHPEPPPIEPARPHASAAILQELLEQHEIASEKLARKAMENALPERIKAMTGEDLHYMKAATKVRQPGGVEAPLHPDMPDGIAGQNFHYFDRPPRKWYDISDLSLLAKLNIAVLLCLLLGAIYYIHTYHPYAPEIIYADDTPYKTRARIENLAPKPTINTASLLHPTPPAEIEPAPQAVPAAALQSPLLAKAEPKPQPKPAEIAPPKPVENVKPPEPIKLPEPIHHEPPKPHPAELLKLQHQATAEPKPLAQKAKPEPKKPESAKPATRAEAPVKHMHTEPLKAQPKSRPKAQPKPSAKPATNAKAGPKHMVPKTLQTKLPAGQVASSHKHSYMAYYVQLASSPSEEAAQKLLTKQAAHFHPQLKNYALNIEKTIIPYKGVYYRLRINVKDAEEAKKLCYSLRQHGGQCIFGLR